MPGPRDVRVGGGSFVNVLLGRLRRRSAGIGLLTLLLILMLLAAVIFALCACKSFGGGSSSP